MRAAISDRRLEAIAGEPLLYTAGPSRPIEAEPGYTTLAVGIYQERANEAPEGQILIHPGGGWLYVRADGSGSRAGLAGWGRQGDAYWGVGIATNSPIRIGGHRTSGGSSWTWAGPLRGAIYSRELTELEAMAVVRYLAAQLSLSLSLSVDPARHSRAHTWGLAA